uniref:Uncharacterized protein n=1 Tax=Steinernema glaseri TaxID=37863 RepID=A0A1I7YFU7_9BILA
MSQFDTYLLSTTLVNRSGRRRTPHAQHLQTQTQVVPFRTTKELKNTCHNRSWSTGNRRPKNTTTAPSVNTERSRNALPPTAKIMVPSRRPSL